MNNAQFDQLFDAAFEEAETSRQQGRSDYAIDHRPSWLRVRKRLSAQRRSKIIRSRLAKFATIASALILGAVIFGNDRAARAIEPIYASLIEYPSGIVSFFFGRNDDGHAAKAKTEAPPGYLEGLSYERINETTLKATVTEAQARSLLSFRAPAFGFLPDGYSLDKATLYFYDNREKADQVIFAFASDRRSMLMLVMQRMNRDSGFGAKNTRDGVTVKQLVDGSSATLVMEADNSSTIESVSNDILISINGSMNSDELIDILEKLRVSMRHE
ncbi:DUF4367 domain-containing protein [Cohnella terricola]|uniref:DUF4367 domain-containing protein n=1 Tax=Cohnella terricola TaxID=1289167 RepID=A0A559JMR8_9BACL|nr:DUF4367 domain-containing protein [Cohnella terricola]TVY01160.1 DUF4367 domain-containing protein [Cohnella terricola]